ncbi:MAG: MFS transporter [Candidatus Limnocylindrales bacterium]
MSALTPASAAPMLETRVRGPWVAFSYLAIWGYLLYGLGNATPYLREDLRLTAFEAGLHASALAIGVLTAGVTADAVARWMGTNRLLDVSVAILVVAISLVALAPALPLSLGGAYLMGLGGGSLGTYTNVQLGRAGGSESRKMMGQANAWAMVAAAAAPIAIGLAAVFFHNWKIALLAAIVALIAVTLLRPRTAGPTTSVRMPRSSLPARYWIAWLLLALAVSIEFSFVFWGSTMVARKTGVSPADATLLISLFVAGMFAGRAAIGRGLGGRRGSRGLLVAGLGLVLVGATLIWVSTVPALAGLGLFLGGLGTAGLWPIGVAVALQIAPKAQFEASARATLASGFAVLIAPSALGLLADEVGVVSAWPVILLVAAAAVVVVAVTPPAGDPKT